VLFRSAKDRVIPIPSLAKIHSKFATPHISIIAFTALGCVLSIAGGFRQLAILSTSSVLLIYLGVALAVVKLRAKNNSGAATFKIPGGLMVPVLSVLIIIWFLTNLTGNETIGMVVFIVVLSIIYYLLTVAKTKPGIHKEDEIKPVDAGLE
jgi:amino acid transporter